MSQEMDALVAQVKANTDVEASAVVAFQNLATQFANAAGDAAKVTELATTLKASAATLAAAIPANTPAA